MVRRFFFKLTWFLPLALLLAGVNYTVDPAQLFHTGSLQIERRAGEWLASGFNIEGLSGYDERKLQLYWLEKLSAPRETMVLGSSKGMLISGPRLLNHSVSGATLPDYLAISQIYRERGWLPKRLLVVADPWLFNRMNRETRWKSLYGQYSRARQSLGLAGLGWGGGLAYRLEIAVQLLSPSYFQASLKQLVQGRPAVSVVPTTAWKAGRVAIKRSDGSICYEKKQQLLTVDEVREIAVRFLTPPVYGLERYEELDSEKQREFEAWLASWKREGTEVVLVLPPYHPETWRRLSASPRFSMVPKTEEYLRSLGYPVVGSYRPEGFTEADFYDGQHAKPDVMERLLRALRL